MPKIPKKKQAWRGNLQRVHAATQIRRQLHNNENETSEKSAMENATDDKLEKENAADVRSEMGNATEEQSEMENATDEKSEKENATDEKSENENDLERGKENAADKRSEMGNATDGQNEMEIATDEQSEKEKAADEMNKRITNELDCFLKTEEPKYYQANQFPSASSTLTQPAVLLEDVIITPQDTDTDKEGLPLDLAVANNIAVDSFIRTDSPKTYNAKTPVSKTWIRICRLRAFHRLRNKKNVASNTTVGPSDMEQSTDPPFNTADTADQRPSENETGLDMLDQPTPEISATDLETGLSTANHSPSPSVEEIVGRRILSVRSVQLGMKEAFKHGQDCQVGDFNFHHEYKAGLSTQLEFLCSCGFQIRIRSNTEEETLPVNTAFAWGAACGPLGYSAAETVLTSMDIPSPCFNFFQKNLSEVNGVIHKTLTDDMIAAGEEEKRLAIEFGDYVTVNGVKYPCIIVLVDGGWSKRSYGHGFTANEGVAVVVGLRTRKILYLATRQKNCATCSRAEREERQPTAHQCEKNWTGASTGMEKDILRKGFEDSIPTHGLVYSKFIGDGDSAVHDSVIDVYPDLEVRKIECRNHLMKNFTKRLIDISKNGGIPKAERKLPGMDLLFHRIVEGINSAVKHHHKFRQNEDQWRLLNADIINTPFHVYGDHSKCQDYFCSPSDRKPSEKDLVPLVKEMVFWERLEAAVGRIASYSASLIECKTTNDCEQFMALANKYIEGKRKNLGQSFLYNLRMYCAGLAYNRTGYWLSSMFRETFGKDPSKLWRNMEKKSTTAREKKRNRSSEPRYKVKFSFLKSSGDFNYGSAPTKPDIPEAELELKITQLINKLQVDKDRQARIEEVTRLQAESDAWFKERSQRITASFAGDIFKLRNTTDNTCMLNRILRKTPFSTKDLEYGKKMEKFALKKYEKKKKATVNPSGLFVSIDNGIFAASPDGLIGEDGLLEIKCPSSLRLVSPKDWPTVNKNASSLKYDGDKLVMKTDHKHFYQVLMQLYVTGRKWCDYCVYTPQDIFVQRIHRTEETNAKWEDLKLKLEEFWKENLAPELEDSRKDRGYEEYRCPPSRQAARDRNITARREKQKKEDLLL